jgi:hypothetical protein
MTMADIPLPWRAYAAHQSSLDTRTSIDATSWGMEEGLNYLLEGESLPAGEVNIDRVVANAARRDRYGRSLLAKHIRIRTEVHDDAGRIEARSSLVLLRRQMAADKLHLLVELASGTEPAHLATKCRIAVGALRTRLARARQIARDIAA